MHILPLTRERCVGRAAVKNSYDYPTKTQAVYLLPEVLLIFVYVLI